MTNQDTSAETRLLATAKAIEFTTSYYAGKASTPSCAFGRKYTHVEGETRWSYSNRVYWLGTGNRELYEQGLQYVDRAVELQELVEALQGREWSTLQNCTSLIDYSPKPSSHYCNNESSLGFDRRSFLGAVLEAGGSVKKAFIALTGDAQLYESYAEDIRATAF